MSNKLIFRILGALSSAVVIVSLFVPFSILQTEGLWDIYSNQGMLYIPIMLLSFAIFSVISFSLNIKSEFAYISFGACLFYIILKIIRMNVDGSFGSISLGFYLFVLGTFFTGVMAFLCNLGKNRLQHSNVDIKDEAKTSELSLSNSLNDSKNLFNPELNLQPNTSIDTLNKTNSSTIDSSVNIFNSPGQNEQVISDNTNIGKNENSNFLSENLVSTQLNDISGVQTISENNFNTTQNIVPSQVTNQQNIEGATLSFSNIPNMMSSDYNYQNSLSQSETSNQQNIQEETSYEAKNLIDSNLGMIQPQNVSDQNVNQNVQKNGNSLSQDLILNQNMKNNSNDLNSVQYNNFTSVDTPLSNTNYTAQAGVTQDVSANILNSTANNISTNSTVLQNEIDSVPEIVSQPIVNNNLATSQPDSTQNNLNSSTPNDNASVPNLDIFGI